MIAIAIGRGPFRRTNHVAVEVRKGTPALEVSPALQGLMLVLTNESDCLLLLLFISPSSSSYCSSLLDNRTSKIANTDKKQQRVVMTISKRRNLWRPRQNHAVPGSGSRSSKNRSPEAQDRGGRERMSGMKKRQTDRQRTRKPCFTMIVI